MTIPGVDMNAAMAVLAAIGIIRLRALPQKLVSYLGLTPSVRQSDRGRQKTVALFRSSGVSRIASVCALCDAFGVGDLIACLPRLKIFEVEEIKESLRANMNFLGLTPAAVGICLWQVKN